MFSNNFIYYILLVLNYPISNISVARAKQVFLKAPSLVLCLRQNFLEPLFLQNLYSSLVVLGLSLLLFTENILNRYEMLNSLILSMSIKVTKALLNETTMEPNLTFINSNYGCLTSTKTK